MPLTPEPPPLTRTEPATETHFGVSVADPYRWLEDEKDPKVQAWMKERDAYARTVLEALPARQALSERLKALVYVETQGTPIKRGNRLFLSVKPADQEKSIHYYQELGGTPRVILNPNTMSADGSVSIGGVFPSHDGKLVAYLEKLNNADESTLKVMTVDTGELHATDQIVGLRYTGASWTPEGDGFYYTWLPTDPTISEEERTGYAEIRFHRLGEPPSGDKTVRARTGDPTRWQGAGLSEDGRYLFALVSHGWSETDVYVHVRGTRKDGVVQWKDLAVGTRASYQVTSYRDKIYLASDAEAPNFEIFEVDPARLERRHWKRIVAERKDAVLESLSVVGGKLALSYLKRAQSEIQLVELNGKPLRTVELPAVGSASGLVGNEDEDTAYFSFSSFTYPWEIYQTSIKDGGRQVYAKAAVPFDPAQFEVSQHSYPSKDGTEISLFLVHQRGLKKDGKNPTLLNGYGGFNVSLSPHFDPSLIAWLERGGVYAMPNLRGGGEYGESWHKAGMLANKQNVFDDFIAAAEWLIKEGYTSPQHLAISGRSNGGLLVGAAVTQRPDLFGAAICGVPLLDMVRYDRFGMGKAWVPEYGSPATEADFHVLYAYSPYHHVKSGTRYPSLLMASADTDDRVDPLHARKFVAQLEAATHGQQPAPLLRIEKNAGHGGADMRAKYVERVADEHAFLWAEVGR